MRTNSPISLFHKSKIMTETEIKNLTSYDIDQYKNDTKPFFLYLAYTAPHDPLMAWPEDIAKYKYDKNKEENGK